MPRDRSRPWLDVKMYGGKAIVRKTTFQDNGNVAAKYGLNTAGDWVLVPEATVYPDECMLPVKICDEVKDADLSLSL